MSIPSNFGFDVNFEHDEDSDFDDIETARPVTVYKIYPIGYSSLQRHEADNLVDNALDEIVETHRFVRIANVTRYPISGIEIIEERWEPVNV